MNQTKILFTDLDGTLLDSKKEISQNVYNKIIEMTNQGHKFVLASGRSLESILQVRNSLELTGKGIYITAYNGALLYDCAADRVLEDYRMELSDAQELFHLAIQNHLHVHTYDETHILSSDESKELAYYRKVIHQPYHITNQLSDYMTVGPHKVLVINIDDRTLLENFRTLISKQPMAERIDSTFSNSKYLEFYSKQAGKGNGLIHLCNILDIPLANSFSMGDEENDISMIKAAGTGIAMNNATDLVKENADFITEQDNDHDGMAEVIEHFIINK